MTWRSDSPPCLSSSSRQRESQRGLGKQVRGSRVCIHITLTELSLRGVSSQLFCDWCYIHDLQWGGGVAETGNGKGDFRISTFLLWAANSQPSLHALNCFFSPVFICPGHETAGMVSVRTVYEIAQVKTQDECFKRRNSSLQTVVKCIIGSAQSLGIKVVNE